MNRITTPGRLLLEDAIPPEYLEGKQEIGKNELTDIFTQIAKKEPENYSDIMGRFSDMSRHVAHSYGREASVGLSDLTTPPELKVVRNQVRKEVAGIVNSNLNPKDKNQAIITLLGEKMKTLPDTVLEAAKNAGSGYYAQVRSGARGNKMQLMQILFGDVMLVDADNKPIPIPVLHGYNEGVEPMEYWAASGGARKGSIDVQFATANAGYLGKQLSNIGHRIIVLKKDCGTKNGLPVDAQDADNIGSVLAAPAKNFPAGTVIDNAMMNKLGKGKILVRSLTTCAMGEGACSLCSGVRESGRLAAVGDQVGIVSTRSMAEPAMQAGLKSKHCLAYGTKVRMADGTTKNVEDLIIGDMVIGSDIYGNTTFVKVLSIFENGVQAVSRYCFHSEGNYRTATLISTPIHKILLTKGDKREVGKVKYKEVAASSKVYDSGDKGVILSEKAAYVRGLIAGSRHITPGKVKNTIRLTGIKSFSRFNFESDGQKGITVSIPEGLTLQQCYKAYNVCSNIMDWSAHSVAAFILGFIDINATVKTCGKSFLTVSGGNDPKLLKLIRTVLRWRLGIHPSRVIGEGIYTFKWLGHINFLDRKINATDLLMQLKDETDVVPMRLVATNDAGEVNTRDIEVDHPDHLFLLDNGLIVSNSGGVAGEDDKKISGFEELNQFLQVPEIFQGASTLATTDGSVSSIKPAPAGGYHVMVNDVEHFIPRGRELLVKKGSPVVAGDMLSDGTPNPSELVHYKGIGEGRKYFVEKFRELLEKNKAGVHRRNIEALARGFINRVRINDVDGYNGYMINDVVPYDDFAEDYEPREGSKTVAPSAAKGTYLETPVMHYSIGTKLTPNVVKDLTSKGVGTIVVHDKEPVVSPEVVKARNILETDPDWMTRLSGENLKRSLLESARMGATSTPASTSYFPAAAEPTKLDVYKGGTVTGNVSKTYTHV